MWLESIRSEDTYFNWDDPSVMREYKNNPLYFRNVIDEKVKNPRPEDVALFGAPSKGAKRVPSDPGVGGVMEYGSNGMEVREGF
jgi:hypothetical protein